MLIIDAHHHLWNYDPVEYEWIGPEMAAIRRSFLPEDLNAMLGANGVRGAVAVQARQTLEETRWLLDLARTHDRMAGVVGWAPLIDAGVEATLERFATDRKLKGVRHILQAEADDRFMLREDFNRGIGLLRSFGLVYDILIYERHLPQAIEFVDRHPEQVFVLDHIAKPRIAVGEISPWKERIADLGKRQNVFCKFSGVVTEADWKRWDAGSIRPYWDAVLESFGPSRMMFGSDWPVLLVASSYEHWMETVRGFTSELTSAEQSRIWGETATAVYGL
jgi:L-fuconolactonase